MTQRSVARTTDQVAMRIYTSPRQPDRDATFDFVIQDVASNATAGYLNVALDLNDDGLVGRYATSGREIQEEWVIRNVPVTLDPSMSPGKAFSILFSLNDMSFDGYAVRNCAVHVTDAPLAPEFPSEIGSLSSWDRFKVILIGSDRHDVDSRGKRFPPAPKSVAQAGRTESREADLDVGTNPGFMPDIPQRSNECGPTSTANSITWMARKHRFASRLPRQDDGSIDTAKIIVELMEAMTGSSARPFKGLTGNQMLHGNQRYAQKRSLPYLVEGGSSDPAACGTKVFDFLARHMARGHEAQLLIWRPNGDGHWVTVNEATQSYGRAFLFVHDPDDSKNAAALWEFAVDSNGRVTDELMFPHSCTAAWAVAEVPTTTNLVETSKIASGSFLLGNSRMDIRTASASIEFALPVRARTSLKIVDLKGSEMVTLVASDLAAGVHRAEWKTNLLPAGVYLYRIEAHPVGSKNRESFTAFRKVLVVSADPRVK